MATLLAGLLLIAACNQAGASGDNPQEQPQKSLMGWETLPSLQRPLTPWPHRWQRCVARLAHGQGLRSGALEQDASIYYNTALFWWQNLHRIEVHLRDLGDILHHG